MKEDKIPSEKLLRALEQAKQIREHFYSVCYETKAQMEELVTTLDNESSAGPSCD